MPSTPILDPGLADLSTVVISKEEILSLNPQRYEFEQLDSILHLDLEANIAVACKQQKSDEFWVRGHIPGRPLMPGVLMIEMAAQLCSIFYHKKVGSHGTKFFGFGGVDKVKFRGSVRPGDVLIMMVKSQSLHSRIAVFDSQGYVNNKMVFEGVITGVII